MHQSDAGRATAKVADRDRLYIDGEWVMPLDALPMPVHDPATEEVVAHVPAAGSADVDRAVAAARAAFPRWADLAPAARATHLDKLHTALAARSSQLAATIAVEVGTPIKVARRVQTGLPLTVLRDFAAIAREGLEPETIGNSLVLREPAGVVGAITPWNYPLHQAIAKIGAALAAGCTVVLKPAELTPLTAYLLFDAIDEAGLPHGVVNLVTGSGPVAGAALAAHPDVDVVSFTGSTATGAAISRLAADRVARVTLELGGKSANIIFDDADLATAVKVGVGNAFLNGGQTCTAWTRMLVHRSVYEEAVDLARAASSGYVTGDPFDPATRLGPLVSAAQRDRVRAYVDRGLADGARLVSGGPDATVPSRGWFVAPTVFSDVEPDHAIAQDEIFGPVLSIIPFSDDDQAVEIANNSRYGLAGAVWSAHRGRALAVARRLRTGAVDINGAAFNPRAPFGGYKQSGNGRELGHHGLAEFLEVKAVQR